MRRSGFTLIEIMIVIAIIGTLAGVLMPRVSLYMEPPASVLQRVFEDAADKALSGMPVRLKIKRAEASKRGEIIAEGLTKKEVAADSLSAFLGTAQNKEILEWQEIKLRNSPDGDGWLLEPDTIYFYTDGSCSPAKISWLSKGLAESHADVYILTVTGYCFKLENNNT